MRFGTDVRFLCLILSNIQRKYCLLEKLLLTLSIIKVNESSIQTKFSIKTEILISYINIL